MTMLPFKLPSFYGFFFALAPREVLSATLGPDLLNGFEREFNSRYKF